MERKPKDMSFNEEQMIKHINLISEDLFNYKYNSYNSLQTPNVFTPKHSSKYKKIQEFWSDPLQKIKQMEPIAENIKKSIYGKFKNENSQSRRIEDSRVSNSEEREEIWNKFLKREKYWQQKQKVNRRTNNVQRNVKTSNPLSFKKTFKKTSKKGNSMEKKKQQLMINLLKHTKEIQLKLLGLLEEAEKSQSEIEMTSWEEKKLENKFISEQSQKNDFNIIQESTFWQKSREREALGNKIYMRYHAAINKAIELNKIIFKDYPQKFKHTLRVAGYVQTCSLTSSEQYHSVLLVGILHQTKVTNFGLYAKFLDKNGLDSLLPNEKDVVISSISRVTPDLSLSKAQREKTLVYEAACIPLYAGWVLLFDRCDTLLEMREKESNRQQLEGYEAVSYLIYVNLTKHLEKITTNIGKQIRQLFEGIGKAIGGQGGANKKAEQYYKMLQ